MAVFDDWKLAEPFHRASAGTLFVSHLSNGSLPNKNFNAWLLNDFVYARCWIYYIARLITSIPSSSDDEDQQKFLENLRKALKEGFKVAEEELDVFKSKASQRGIVLPTIPDISPDYNVEAQKSEKLIFVDLERSEAIEPGCTEYIRWMTITMLSESEYHWTTLLAVLWMLEKVYCEAMWAVRKGPGFDKLDESTKDFVSWWAKEEFRKYVALLEKDTNTVRNGEWGWKEAQARSAVEQVLKLEEGFWGIAEAGLEPV
jgi:thiaminase